MDWLVYAGTDEDVVSKCGTTAKDIRMYLDHLRDRELGLQSFRKNGGVLRFLEIFESRERGYELKAGGLG